MRNLLLLVLLLTMKLIKTNESESIPKIHLLKEENNVVNEENKKPLEKSENEEVDLKNNLEEFVKTSEENEIIDEIINKNHDQKKSKYDDDDSDKKRKDDNDDSDKKKKDDDDDSDNDINNKKNWIFFYGIYCCNLHYNHIENCCKNGGFGPCCGNIDDSYYGKNCCVYNDTWKKVCCDRNGYGDCCSSLPKTNNDIVPVTNCCEFPMFLRQSCCISNRGNGSCCSFNTNIGRYCCSLNNPWRYACCHSGGFGQCC